MWLRNGADLSNQLTNWLVAFATPIFLARSAYGAYFLFGSLSSFTVVVLAIWMPETKGKSLEAIELSFPQPGVVNSPPLADMQRRAHREDVQE